jgi:putative hydrolase of HD superfamily
MNIDEIQKLLGFVDKFKQIERALYNPGQDRQENDAEHTYELMLLCWFLALRLREKGKILDLEKVFIYALVHDLVETYAGDTDVYNSSQASTKKERERDSLRKIEKEFSFFPEISNMIRQYEMQNDPESVFVKSVDKIGPALSVARDSLRSYKVFHPKLKLDVIHEEKRTKIKDPDILEIWNQIYEEFKLDKHSYWKTIE